MFSGYAAACGPTRFPVGARDFVQKVYMGSRIYVECLLPGDMAHELEEARDRAWRLHGEVRVLFELCLCPRWELHRTDLNVLSFEGYYTPGWRSPMTGALLHGIARQITVKCN